MIRSPVGLMAVTFGLATQAQGASARTAGGPPRRVGQCATTSIIALGSRLDGVPDSGGVVSYRNGGVQVSYAVRMRLVAVPDECPPGDDRGKVYRVTNLRTHTRWEAPDSEHGCGGA